MILIAYPQAEILDLQEQAEAAESVRFFKGPYWRQRWAVYCICVSPCRSHRPRVISVMQVLLAMVRDHGMGDAERDYESAQAQLSIAQGATRFLRAARLADGTTERRFLEEAYTAGQLSYHASTLAKGKVQPDETMLR